MATKDDQDPLSAGKDLADRKQGIIAAHSEHARQAEKIRDLTSELARNVISHNEATKELRRELLTSNAALHESHAALADAHRALEEASATLEAHIALRTVELNRAVVQLSEKVLQGETALEVQKLLAREIDHRIRNSLQLVISLLVAQASAAPTAAEQQALRQASMRVQAIAHTHGVLYRHENLNAVPFHVYLPELCRELQKGLLPEGPVRVVIDCRCEACEVPAEFSFPLRLIVTELVTNAIKHAFPDQRAGRVEVTFQRRGNKGWRLVVADNGVGLGPKPTSTGGVGTQVIRAMVERLHGRLESETSGGARFVLDIERR